MMIHPNKASKPMIVVLLLFPSLPYSLNSLTVFDYVYYHSNFLLLKIASKYLMSMFEIVMAISAMMFERDLMRSIFSKYRMKVVDTSYSDDVKMILHVVLILIANKQYFRMSADFFHLLMNLITLYWFDKNSALYLDEQPKLKIF